MLTYDEFKAFVVSNIDEFLPASFSEGTITIDEVTKNNGVSKSGLKITGLSNCEPVIYLEAFYDAYKKGDEIYDVVGRIADSYIDARGRNMEPIVNGFDPGSLLDWDKQKDNIVCQLVGTEANTERLSKCPSVAVEDMSVLFRIRVMDNAGGMGSILVDNNVMKQFNVNAEELFETAKKNMIENNDFRFNGLGEMLGFPIAPDEETMFVATNRNSINGANVILVDEFREHIANKLGENFYVLPSSIHEALCIPESQSPVNYLELTELVKSANSDVVSAEEILSDNVYHYDAKEKIFETAKAYTERKGIEVEKSEDLSMSQELTQKPKLH